MSSEGEKMPLSEWDRQDVDDNKDVLSYDNPEDESDPLLREVPAGTGQAIVSQHEKRSNMKQKFRIFQMGMLVLIGLTVGFVTKNLLLGVVLGVIVPLVFRYGVGVGSDPPELLVDNSDRK